MTKKSAQFTWQLQADPPTIKEHSDAKLRLLEAYLDRYFDVVCAQPHIDVLRIALVDAFSGGGLFRRNGEFRYGSPLVMIDAVRRAETRINSTRRKPLKIEAKFFFVDKDANAVEFLHHSLETTEIVKPFSDVIQVRNATASDVLPAIIEEIANWSPIGRSIFFMDQCGYGEVPNWDVRHIYQSLPKSEVIVTYNFGAIYDYMNDQASFLAGLDPLEITPENLRALLRERERQAGRYFAGRLLGRLFKIKVGSQFASRFFLHSQDASRDIWFVHYSKHPRSRLVMNDAHWAIKNTSITQGEAGLDMLGFRQDWEHQLGVDFGFSETDEGHTHTALMADLPRWLEQFDRDAAPTLDALLALSADDTAATENQIKMALKVLESEGEIEVLTPSNARKSSGADIRSSHRIILPWQGKFRF